ncbi:hypothetical protein VTL71DRAFT_15106 [Oculimacula yallundae]|uniref:Uncharacterized protein n=1 Tax=Oculimacula yallundae TaxID=86028 RepID=A0ABR4CHV0_9HELO
MKIQILPSFRISFLATVLWIAVGNALITRDAIRNLTIATDGYRERILEVGDVGSEGLRDGGRGGGEVREEGRQIVMSGGGGVDEGEIEDTVAAALRMLCTDILIELEKPLTITPPPSPGSPHMKQTDCVDVKKEFHDFLGATVKFLYVVQERQMIWRWGSDSAVLDGVAWMQGLWASRRTNSQNRSFIEQQMSMYAETGCFGKSKEVLRRDVEVVEYLNDLMDLFA